MAPYLEWSAKYATGIGPVDGEHQTLFMMINALHDVVAAGEPEIDLAGLFVRLGDYVETHFRREERLMAAAGYPFLAEHIAEHRELTDTLYRFMDEMAAAPETFPTEDFLDFLRNWLAKHVIRSDMEYVPHVNRAAKES